MNKIFNNSLETKATRQNTTQEAGSCRMHSQSTKTTNLLFYLRQTPKLQPAFKNRSMRDPIISSPRKRNMPFPFYDETDTPNSMKPTIDILRNAFYHGNTNSVDLDSESPIMVTPMTHSPRRVMNLDTIRVISPIQRSEVSRAV